MKKRFLSVLLALCMLLPLFPAEALAAEDGTEPTEAGTVSQEDMENPEKAEEEPEEIPSEAPEAAAEESDAVEEDDASLYAAPAGEIYQIPGGKIYFDTATGTITGHIGTMEAEIVIPSVIDGVPVTAIGDQAFKSIRNLVKIEIPNSVTSIGKSAFNGCYALTAVKIPDGVTQIPAEAFSSCSSLRSITIPNSVTSIGDLAFAICEAMEEVTIGENVVSIGESAFVRCSSITSVTIPNSVTSIGKNAFGSCSSLESITLPDGITEIADGSFSATGLTSITIPDSVTYIGESAFSGCTNLRSVTIPGSVTRTGKQAFRSCTGLESVVILPGLVTIGPWTFQWCKNLSSITIPSTVTTIEYGAFSLDRYPPNLVEVYFGGTLAQWKNIDMTSSNFVLEQDAIIHFVFAQHPTSPDEDLPIDTDSYYGYPAQRLFRIRPVGSRYPCDAGFKVTVNGQTYDSGKTTCSSTDDVTAAVPPSYTGDIIFSREGYYNNTLPARLAGAYNHVIMTPTTVKGIFANTLVVSNGTPKYPKFVNVAANLQGSELSILEPGISSPAVTREYYVSINWNGHRDGTVWLEQGTEKIELTNNASKSFAIETVFVPGKTVYLCAKAGDGTQLRMKTSINIRIRQNDDMQLGMEASASATVSGGQGTDSLDVIKGQKFELDFSELSEKLIPCKFEISKDGSIKGTIGLETPDGKFSEAAYMQVKETVDKLQGKSQLMSNIDTAKQISNLQKAGKLTDSYAKVGTRASLQVVGCFTGSMVNAEFRITEMSAVIIGKGSASCEFQTYISAVPVYLKTVLAVQLQLAYNFKYREQIKKFTPDDTKLSAKVSVSLEGGVGRDYIASLGGKGTGTVGMEMPLPGTAEDFVMTFGANLSVVGSICGVSGEWELSKLRDMIIWENGGPAWRYKDPVEVYDTGFVPDLTLTAMAFSAGEDGNTIAKNVSGYTSPALLELPDERLLAVWTADVPGRRGLDKNGLYYSVRSAEGGWSEAKPVWDDGSNDSIPALWQAGGEVWLTWQNYTTTYNTDTLDSLPYETLAGQIDVAAAKFNAETSSFTAQNIPCAGYACQPQISLVDGAVRAAWRDLNGIQWSSTYDAASGWSAAVAGTAGWYAPEAELPSTYTEEAPATTSALQTFSTPEYQAILYTAAKEEGRENVYGLFNDGFGWGEPLQLTEVSSGSIGGFSASISQDGVLRLLVNQVNRNADGSYQSADLAFYEEALFSAVDLTVSNAYYVHDTLVPGGTLTVTADVTNNSARTVSALTAAVNGTISNHQITLLPGQTKTVYINYDLPNTFSPNLTVTVTPRNETDANTSDNSGTCILETVDLSLEEIIAEQTGTELTLTPMVVNRGTTSIAGCTVTYHRDAPDGEVILTQTIDTSIPAGAAVYPTITAMTAAPLEPGTMVYAEAALPSAAVENLYGNNTNQAVVVQPSQDDMAVSAELRSPGVVQLTDPYGVLSGCKKVLAAVYNSDGKMLSAAAGTLETDNTVRFSKSLEAGWTLFLLDGDDRPVYQKIMVE